MNVGESQLENERKIDDLMLGIRELRKVILSDHFRN